MLKGMETIPGSCRQVGLRDETYSAREINDCLGFDPVENFNQSPASPLGDLVARGSATHSTDLTACSFSSQPAAFWNLITGQDSPGELLMASPLRRLASGPPRSRNG
jgi:hypothetical protein